MSIVAWYAGVKLGHLALVALSGTLFVTRGLAVLSQARGPMSAGVRIASVVIDTLLLAAGVALWALLDLNPVRDHWLASKLALLVLYVALGTMALKRERRPAWRAAWFMAALIVFAAMASVAWTRHPLGIWHLL